MVSSVKFVYFRSQTWENVLYKLHEYRARNRSCTRRNEI
jgi:hypothetical protein